MTELIRIPLAWPIGTRSGTNTSKDPYIFNGMLEKYGEKLTVVKRAGTDIELEFLDAPDPGALDQGIFYWQNMFWAVVDDVLYRDPATSPTVGTTGLMFTAASLPQWAAMELQGATVFNNRMWLISGVTDTNGIWSSVDGENWVSNAAAPPWGFRLRPGVTVFNGAMYVMGGYDPLNNMPRNDVWKSFDGTNWELISADALPDKWSGRAGFCCLAATNGIYVYGGSDDGTTNFYNDVWFTADGITWNEVTAAAPWATRWGAAFYWFNNQIWVAAGNNGAAFHEDCWYSPDGINWTLATAQMFVGGVTFPYFAVYRNLLWIIGGVTSGGNTNFVANSPDGATWTIQGNGNFCGRGNGQMLVFGIPASVDEARYQTMYLLGGSNGVVSLQESLYGDLDFVMPTFFPLNPRETGQQYQFNTYINGQILLLKNQSNFWYLQSGTLIEVTDENYPITTVPGLVVLNAFAYVMTPQGEIHNCKLENPAVWPSLDFITADYEDDPGVALAKHLNYVVALNQYSTQFFYDNGANQPVGTPLALYVNANMRIGCASANSVAVIDNSLFWESLTRGGGRQTVRLDGLQMTPVSTPYVDKILMTTPPAYMQGFSYSIEGHQYYCIKTSVLDALVYDVSQREWYEWDVFPYIDSIDNGDTDGIFLWPFAGGTLVVTGQAFNTDVLEGDYAFFCQTDKIDFGNMALKFCGRVNLVGDKSDATPSITYSDDDYVTTVTAGTVNMLLERPYLTRLGSFRRRSWKPVQTDDNPARWEALEIEYNQGES